jgi:hypothetical protein
MAGTQPISEAAQSAQPFVFHTESRLVVLTGRKARTAAEMPAHLTEVSGSSIFYHTHYLYLTHHFEKPTFYNDFAKWVSEALQEERLAELEEVSASCLHFHFFEARLRLERPTNDFSQWLAERVRGRVMQHINSTSVGGGVAEIPMRLIPLLRELGIDARWNVIKGDQSFFNVTKAFHNALHGKAEDISAEMFEIFLGNANP